jgi:hypothetical protein
LIRSLILISDAVIDAEDGMSTIQSNNISQTYEEINILIALGIRNAEYLHTYYGICDNFSFNEHLEDIADWNIGVNRIIDQYDTVLQELADL